MEFESSFEFIPQSEYVPVFYCFLGSLEVRTIRWKGLGRSSAFRKGDFLTECYNLINAVGLALPSPSARSLTPVMYQVLLAPLCSNGIASESSDKKWVFLSPAEVV